MKKIHWVIALLFLCLSVSLQAQYRSPSGIGDITDKIYFGGGGGFSGGTQFLSISLSPYVGYKITEQFSAGMQITYQYTRLSGFSASNYGGGPFLLYAFSEKIFTYTQYEYLNVQPLVVGGTKADRLDFTSWFVGLGYNEPLSDLVSFQIIGLYNLMYGDGTNSPYNSPLQFRVGLVTNF